LNKNGLSIIHKEKLMKRYLLLILILTFQLEAATESQKWTEETIQEKKRIDQEVLDRELEKERMQKIWELRLQEQRRRDREEEWKRQERRRVERRLQDRRR
jgi:hypothetical protein